MEEYTAIFYLGVQVKIKAASEDEAYAIAENMTDAEVIAHFDPEKCSVEMDEVF